jgi:D-3-phosphoglycerate dehydrogenase
VPKALYFDILEYTRENLELLRKLFEVTRLPNPDHCTGDALKDVEVVFAPLGYRFDAEFMQRAPRLKVLATNTTGVPHIDEQAAESRGIEVVSLAGDTEFLESITPTAELTLGLMIALTRNVAAALHAVKEGTWRRWDHGGERMLSRMHLGIVGLGRLGRMVARYASALGMRVSYYDPDLTDDSPATSFTRMGHLEELVAAVDIVSLHANVSINNAHMFNDRIFSRFRRGAYFVNTARGELVDSAALIRALDSGQLAGAALDVLDGEFSTLFNPSNHPLIRYAQSHSNLLITPHIGGSTKDAWALTQERTIRKALAALPAET